MNFNSNCFEYLNLPHNLYTYIKPSNLCSDLCSTLCSDLSLDIFLNLLLKLTTNALPLNLRFESIALV